MKRLNPETGQLFKRNDVRADGFVFVCYLPKLIKRDGYCKEKWLSPGAWERAQKSINNASQLWAKRQNTWRVQYVAEYKLQKGCMDCGYRLHHTALDLDHRESEEKLFTVAQGLATYNWDKILAEIAKCDVVCANCHRIRTHIRAKRAEGQKKLMPAGFNSVASCG